MISKHYPKIKRNFDNQAGFNIYCHIHLRIICYETDEFEIYLSYLTASKWWIWRSRKNSQPRYRYGKN
ncbi:unnamed protein product [Rhizophagus irregularis]|nr:unnamed protein product [Rhizophagus irregularis]